MKFEVEGIAPGPELDDFCRDWRVFTEQENRILFNDARGQVSQAQLLIINLCCGKDQVYQDLEDGEPVTISSIGSIQTEFESVIRARQRALSEMFRRAQLEVTAL